MYQKMDDTIYKAIIKAKDGTYCVRTMLVDGTPITLEIFKTYEEARAYFQKLPYPKATQETIDAFNQIAMAS